MITFGSFFVTQHSEVSPAVYGPGICAPGRKGRYGFSTVAGPGRMYYVGGVNLQS